MEKEVNLCGKLCPFTVMCVLKEVEAMKVHERYQFLVDDPLAIKSIPEELEERDDLAVTIERNGKKWKILIQKQDE